MQYQGVWILFILALVVSILPGFLDNGNGTIVPCLIGQLDNRTSPFFCETHPIFPTNLLNMPSIPRVYRNSLPGGVERQVIDLSWNNQNNPHTVVIYPPDTSLGPFQNTDDGKLDQRIYLEVSSPSNLTPGIWYYTVGTDNTTTDENDSFRIYRNNGVV